MSAYSPIRLELELLPTAHTPGIARRRLAETFAAVLGTDELHDAKLLTSELVTNALIHGRGSIELHALLDQTHLAVGVADQGGGFERTARQRGLDAVGGHGLHIVEVIASRWGIHQGTSHVWFELDRYGPRFSS